MTSFSKIEQSRKYTNAAIAFLLLFLIILPVNFIADGVSKKAEQNYNRRLLNAHIELQHELLRFKLDLTPRYQVESMIKEVEQACGLVSFDQIVAKGDQKQSLEIYNGSTLRIMLEKFKQKFNIQPIFLLTVSPDVKNINTHYHEDLNHLSPQEKMVLEANLACGIADTRNVESVLGDSLADSSFQKLKEFAMGKLKESSDSLYCAMRFTFSEMYSNPKNAGRTVEICSDRFDSMRIFFHFNRLKEGEKIYGGYSIVFASRDLTPEMLINRALCPKRDKMLRFVGRIPAPSPNWLLLEGHIPAEINGYSSLFKKHVDNLKVISVARDFSSERRELWLSVKTCSTIKKAAFLLATFIFWALILRGWPQFGKLKRQFLLLISVIVLVPYIFLGHLSLMLMDSSNNLRTDEAQTELERYMYELERHYSDQKLQIIIRLMVAKKRLIPFVKESEDFLQQLNGNEIVEAGSCVDFYFYRNDGYSRKLDHSYRNSKRPSRFYSQISANILNNLGFLDKTSKVARKDLELSGYADGFLSEMKRGFLEHKIFTAEGIESKDFTRVDDLSRMVYFLTPPNKKPDAPIVGMVIAPLSDANSTIFQIQRFNDDAFFKQQLFSGANLAMAFRRPDDTVGKTFPEGIGVGSSLKQLLEFSALSHNSGRLMKIDENGFSIDKWKFIKDDSLVYAGHLSGINDLRFDLLVRVFPLLLFLFSLISLFLFSDLLNSLFVAPVAGFSKAAEEIGKGNYQIRLITSGNDELTDLALAFNKMADGLAQRERLRRFISEEIYLQIQKQKEDFEKQKLQGRQMSVLASDIRNFTVISEKYKPEEIVCLLNDYFTEMETAITSSGGHIVQFVGDAVVAAFYEKDQDVSSVLAAMAAVKMRQALVQLNQRRRELKLFTIENGIGIATGEALAGVAGSEQGRKVFCVIGDLTGKAEKLEALSKMSKFNRILVCQNTVINAKDRLKLAKLDDQSSSEDIFDLIGVNDG